MRHCALRRRRHVRVRSGVDAGTKSARHASHRGITVVVRFYSRRQRTAAGGPLVTAQGAPRWRQCQLEACRVRIQRWGLAEPPLKLVRAGSAFRVRLSHGIVCVRASWPTIWLCNVPCDALLCCSCGLSNFDFGCQNKEFVVSSSARRAFRREHSVQRGGTVINNRGISGTAAGEGR